MRPGLPVQNDEDLDLVAEVDPTSPGYDAHALMLLRGEPISRLAAKEPRDEVFASAREATLKEVLSFRAEALEEANVEFTTTCFTGTCRVDVVMNGASADELDAALAALQPYTLGDAAEVGGVEDGEHGRRFTTWLVFGKERRDQATYERWLEAYGDLPPAAKE